MEIFGIYVPIWISLMVAAIILYTFLMSRDFLTFWRMGIPGPTPLPIVGNRMSMTSKGVRAFDQTSLKKYGKVYGHFDMLSTNLVVADKEMMREILVKQFNNFPDRRTFGEGFAGDMDHGLAGVKGTNWKYMRSVITPAFSSGKLRQMVPLIQDGCNTLIKTARNAIQTGDGGQVEMKRLFGGFTMDVISSTAFGIKVDSQNNPDDLFVIHAKRMFDFSLTKLWVLAIVFFPAIKPLLIKFGASLFPKDSLAYFRNLTFKMLNERKENKEMGRKDFLQLMIDAQEGRLEVDDADEDSKEHSDLWSIRKHHGLTYHEILGNAELFFVAGYETTAIALTMNAYNLASHPECQDRLRQEIEENIGSEEIDFENVKNLQYLDMCINETLRLYPTAVRFDRVCVKTSQIKNITIPAGMAVSVPVYAIHHDPDIWENPDVFNPERFSSTEKASHDPLDFIPFGYGPRQCVAMRLAFMEAKMATVHIVRNFRLHVGSKTEIPPTMEEKAIVKPLSMWLKLEEIK
ncbi:cytochrome P450 3A2-like [Ylistrum balloti]|uniref:cytochrome P450 3A2-like n=1 Tax=Ylistrum balloti TaxID=509963 RepID=UPI002905ED0C|nr:cytochrome P450 3A2-like [Ylistrum balloti]